jgi:heme-degrading monooxygenase HmoA
MSELVTTGVWNVRAGHETEFVQEWTRFANWAATMPGATTLRLGFDVTHPARYVSFAAWDDADAAHAWKQTAEFRERMAQVMVHVDAFEPAELSVVATAGATVPIA